MVRNLMHQIPSCDLLLCICTPSDEPIRPIKLCISTHIQPVRMVSMWKGGVQSPGFHPQAELWFSVITGTLQMEEPSQPRSVIFMSLQRLTCLVLHD